MNYPLKPSEMFLNARGNIFPLADLKEVAATIVTKKHDYEEPSLVWRTSHGN